MDEIINSLIVIGLSKKEARAYIALLKIGSGSAYKVSQESGIKKPTTYVILDELRKKGAVLKIPGSKKTIYKAKEPTELFQDIENSLQKSKKIIPQLMAIGGDGKDLKTFYFEGFRGIDEALHYNIGNIKDSKMVGFYAKAENVTDDFMKITDKWGRSLKQHDIHARVIVPNHPSLEKYRLEDEKDNRKVKVIPHNLYSSEISIDTDGQFVRIVDLVELQAVIIDNPRVAKTIEEIFEMVWGADINHTN